MHHHHYSGSSLVSEAIRSQMRIAEFFREKSATSPEKSVEVTALDWEAMGVAFMGNKMPEYIVKTGENRYWLDLKKLEQVQEKRRKAQNTVLKVFGIIFIVFFIIIAIVFCLNLTVFLGIAGTIVTFILSIV